MNIKPGYLGALLLLISGSSWASCSFTQGGVGPGPFTIPALVVSQDATPGTILYSQELVGSAAKLKCTGVAPIYKGYRYLSTRWENSVGLSAVYKTNVPGIGIQAKWNSSGESLAADGNYILSYFEAQYMTEDYEYTLSPRIGIRIVVIGPIESGTIDASRLLAEWVFDNQTVAQLTFNPVSVNVQANTCNLVEKIFPYRLNRSQRVNLTTVIQTLSQMMPSKFSLMPVKPIYMLIIGLRPQGRRG